MKAGSRGTIDLGIVPVVSRKAANLHSLHRSAFSLVGLIFALACASDPAGQSPGSGSGGGSSGGGGSGGSSVIPGGGSTSGGSAAVAGSGTSGAGTASVGGGGAGGTLAGAGSGGSSAASGGNAGGASAGTGGSGGGSAANGCNGVTAKFCDDFEAQMADMPPKGDFNIDAKAGQIVVDSSKAYSGSKALHIKSPKPGSQSFLNFSKQFPMNDFHGRAMMYLATVPTAEFHWDVIDAVSQNNVNWEIGGMYGKFILVVDPPDHGLTSNPFPAGKWFCLQWEFKYGGQGMDNTFLAKMDGTALQNGQFTGADSQGKKWDAGPWKTLQIGWTGYGSSDVDIEEWIDDLAFGDMPIACPAAK
jgi:hypothetical protein